MAKITKKDCSGCRDNVYNGNNGLGIQECWCFKSAKMVKRLQVPIDLAPPFLHIKPQTVPDCMRIPRYVLVRPDAITKDGFWR